MGDAADDARAHEEFLSNEYNVWDEYYKNLNAKVWKTKLGTLIPIGEMTSQHIKNTITFLMKTPDKFEFAKDWVPLFREELFGREEGLNNYFHQIKEKG